MIGRKRYVHSEEQVKQWDIVSSNFLKNEKLVGWILNIKICETLVAYIKQRRMKQIKVGEQQHFNYKHSDTGYATEGLTISSLSIFQVFWTWKLADFNIKVKVSWVPPHPGSLTKRQIEWSMALLHQTHCFPNQPSHIYIFTNKVPIQSTGGPKHWFRKKRLLSSRCLTEEWPSNWRVN